MDTARFTPDGQSIIYCARREGQPSQMYSQRLDTLEPDPLGLPVGRVLAVSPTSELALILTAEENLGSPGIGTLGRANLGSTSVREVLEDVVSADWTPDSRLLVLRRLGDQWQFEWPLGQVVCRWASRHWHHPRLSPDGQTVARLDPSGALRFMDRAGRETHAEGPSGQIQSFAWHPRKNEVWYTTWPVGPDVQLRAVDRSGRDRLVHYFGHPVEIQDVTADSRILMKFLSPASLGFARVRAPGAEREMDVSFHSRTLPLALSGDGSTVLLQKGLPPEPQGGYFVRSTVGGPPLRIRGFGEGEPVDLAPDGGRVLFLESAPRPRIVSVPVGPGEPTVIPLGNVIPSGGKWFPDGRTLIIKGRVEGEEARLFTWRAAGSGPQPLAAVSHDTSLMGFYPSPDGREIAVQDGSTLTIHAVDGGESRTVSADTGADVLLGWGGVGRRLIMRHDRLSLPAPARLYLLDPVTREAERLRDLMPPEVSGLIEVPYVGVARGGEAYAYYYAALESNLFVVNGLE